MARRIDQETADRYMEEYERNLTNYTPPTPAWTPFRYHKIQADLWRTTKRFVGVYAGRGSGKTEIAKRKLVRCLSHKRPWGDPRYFYGAPTLGQARRIAWNSLLELTPPDIILDVRVGDGIIMSKFGVSLHIVGLDAPMRQEGVQWDGGVIDESCDIKPKTFDLSILPTLTHRSGWCWRIGVPKRKGVGAKEFKAFCDRASSGDNPEEAVFTWPSSDVVDSATLEYARRVMDRRDYAEQFEATWDTGGSGAFHAYSDDANVRPCPYIPDKPLVIGCDFNRTPMSWIIGHIYGNMLSPEWLEIIDAIVLTDATTRNALDVLWDRYSSHRGGFLFHCDASSSSRHTSADTTDYIQILNDKRFKQSAGGSRILFPRRRITGKLEGNPSIKNRLSACNALFENAEGVRRFFVSPEVHVLRQDLMARVLKDGTWTPDDSALEGHITDALGYLIWRHWPVTLDFEEEDVGTASVGIRRHVESRRV